MTRNIFDTPITCWSNTKRTHANNITVTIGQFLEAGAAYLHRPQDATDIYRLRLLYTTALQTYPTDPARAASFFEQYKEQKKSMPLAATGGTFSEGGLRGNLITPSNVLCLDLDQVKPTDYYKYADGNIPNKQVTDWELLKLQLARLPFVAYAGLSIGGYGLFVLLPIADASRYTDYWLALEHLFKKHLNLTIDPRTKDITRPRFISYDPQPYVNQNAEVFDKVLPRQRPRPQVHRYSTTTRTSTEQAVRKCVEEIERKRLDITSDYSDWIDIASALYNELGEAGKQYYERLSIFYPIAKAKEIEYKWNKNKNRRKVGIGTFFDICARHGIKYKDSVPLSALPRPKPTPKRAPVEATPSTVHIPLFPQPYDYMATYSEHPLPPDFFRERQEAAPF